MCVFVYVRVYTCPLNFTEAGLLLNLLMQLVEVATLTTCFLCGFCTSKSWDERTTLYLVLAVRGLKPSRDSFMLDSKIAHPQLLSAHFNVNLGQFGICLCVKHILIVSCDLVNLYSKAPSSHDERGQHCCYKIMCS